MQLCRAPRILRLDLRSHVLQYLLIFIGIWPTLIVSGYGRGRGEFRICCCEEVTVAQLLDRIRLQSATCNTVL